MMQHTGCIRRLRDSVHLPQPGQLLHLLTPLHVRPPSDLTEMERGGRLIALPGDPFLSTPQSQPRGATSSGVVTLLRTLCWTGLHPLFSMRSYHLSLGEGSSSGAATTHNRRRLVRAVASRSYGRGANAPISDTFMCVKICGRQRVTGRCAANVRTRTGAHLIENRGRERAPTEA